MSYEIIVDVDQNGDTKIETRGFRGTDCLKETAELERKLGVKTADRMTRESNQSATAGNVARNSGRS